MKLFALILLTAVGLLPLRADEWLENADFTDSLNHWYGEAKQPSDFAPPDPFSKPDPFTSQGMIFPLRGSQWIKAFQDFKGKGENAILKITYVLSPGLTFSARPDDYQNMPDKIGWDAWKSFDSPPGAWIVFISELEQRHGTYYVIQPDLSSTKEQTFSAPINGMTAWSRKTIALAFPPGNGTVVLHSVQIVDP